MKRPIVVEGNTPGKPETKRPPIKGTSKKSLFQDEVEFKKSLGKQDSIFACPATKQEVTSGQCNGTTNFGMLVPLRSTRLVMPQEQVCALAIHFRKNMGFFILYLTKMNDFNSI